jgi:hypothetical protein
MRTRSLCVADRPHITNGACCLSSHARRQTVGCWVLIQHSRHSLWWRKVPKDCRDKDQRRHVTDKVSVFMLIAHSLNRHDCGMDEARPHCE